MSFYQHLQSATTTARNSLVSAPIVAAALAGRVTREMYLRFLARAFHHVRHTPSLLMACGARVPAHQEWLRAQIAHYIDEEIGHHEWILNDIAAAGGDAQAVRNSEADFDTDVMVAYAYDTVLRRNPVGLFGMVYVLEGTSVSLATKVAAAVQNALGLPETAFTYLNSHGTLDIEHMGYFEKLVNRLDSAEDRVAVEASAKTFFRLYGNVLHGVETQVSA
ncbi:MAG: iron-containing redox enzyme family protein [Rhodanobacter sp.]|jgi:heme oxygenase|nr:iron-containing redox enzyme family protein [Rhodanobacter sp.]